ncbi:MAG: MASE1 domain-containing protein [Armatimonadetes bacterium]|nr:MASE1 domain-containing protein [Armatimonadota bacterium]
MAPLNWGRIGLIALVYTALAWSCVQYFNIADAQVSVYWFPSGFLFGMILVHPRNYRWPIILTSVPLGMIADLSISKSTSYTIFLNVADFVGIFLMIWFMDRVLRRPPTIQRVWDVGAIFLAGFIGSIGAGVIASIGAYFNKINILSAVIQGFVVATSLGVIATTPAILGCCHRAAWQETAKNKKAAFWYAIGSLGSALFVFLQPGQNSELSISYVFLPLPFLVAQAYNRPAHETSLTVSLVALIGGIGASLRLGPMDFLLSKGGGAEYWLHTYLLILCGSIILLAAMNQERLRYIERLQQQRDRQASRVQRRTIELQQRNSDLETLSYSMSHDLRAPLRNISAQARLAFSPDEPLNEAEVRASIESIDQSAMRMSRLLDDLLSYARAGRRPLELGMVDLNHTVEQALAGPRKSPGFRHEVKVQPLPTVEADPVLLRQVVDNLIDNAIKYSGRVESPQIEIRGGENGEWSWMEVKDNGAGFDPAYGHKIFGLFERLHPGRDFEGTGVGLAIVQRAMERMGGQVMATSKPNEGALFRIEFPRNLLARRARELNFGDRPAEPVLKNKPSAE